MSPAQVAARGRSHRGRAAAAALSAAWLLAVWAPAAGGQPMPPDIGARAAIVVDARNGEMLYARRADDRRAIASATKLMTALLALEHASLRDVFTAPQYDASPIESKIGLRRGERMTVHDLLRALLLESANDAAVTIAVNVAGSRPAFVRRMNDRAGELGFEGTNYANPIGLDDPDNYSTARDLADLAVRLMRDGRFARIVDMPRATLRSGSRVRVVANRNLLIRRHPFVDGIKTGHTRAAGWVLVGSGTGRGVRVVSVVLGNPSENARDSDTLALLRYGLGQFRRVKVLSAGSTVARADVMWHDGRASLTTPADVRVTVRRGERPSIRVDAPSELEGPLAAGARVGSATVVYRGRRVRTVPLVVKGAVRGAGPLRRLTSEVGPALTLLAFLAIVLLGSLAALRYRAVRLRSRRTPT